MKNNLFNPLKIPIIRWERDSQPILESGRVKVSTQGILRI